MPAVQDKKQDEKFDINTVLEQKPVIEGYVPACHHMVRNIGPGVNVEMLDEEINSWLREGYKIKLASVISSDNKNFMYSILYILEK